MYQLQLYTCAKDFFELSFYHSVLFSTFFIGTNLIITWFLDILAHFQCILKVRKMFCLKVKLSHLLGYLMIENIRIVWKHTTLKNNRFLNGIA